MHVLILDTAQARDIDLEAAVLGPGFTVEAIEGRDPARVDDAVWARADAVLSWLMPIGPAEVARLARCRILVKFGVGYDIFDIEAAGRAGIPVCNVPDYGTGEVADHAMAMMLSLRRGLPSFQRLLAGDPAVGWQWSAGPLMRRVATDRLGIVGIGRIGEAVARRALGFDMRIGWYDPYVAAGRDLPGQRMDRLEDLLAASDIVSVHCPLTAETRGMIGRRALAAIRPGAILVNTARGAVVDLGAVHDALRSGHLGGAAIDVFPEEPPDPALPLVAAFREQPAWAAGRIVLSPHAAFFSPESWREQRQKAAATARDMLLHGEVRNCVNARFLPVSGLRGRGKTD